MRLEEHPILKFERGPQIEFYFEGKAMKAYLGETIAAALHANDVKILSHSAKTHSPRGLYCAIGNCSSCLMTVNGIPNVRVCVELIEAGDDVRIQKGKGDLL
ncbi:MULTISPECIES: (2Fe-2S)-binding protein [unclassified Fusibacter]|uniref:(2Fe-2S)-binding protein n=1 Tax=unclassified Fusibacter TaxID=2624464 RepID=UPI001011BA5F|nr:MULTISPECIES: (2Fe-2S)-binding protein [unclassified Fusibacter]MCK8059580.1 (2Fe-2S)-binding protein [Fusibacter sp. A2]NPE21381.1 (2Fe-2S)-binding protein [Fusibacter sp. A1]RXV61797.1 (2Fe-2S)-binding protein [Fusibacter sp. A1]